MLASLASSALSLNSQPYHQDTFLLCALTVYAVLPCLRRHGWEFNEDPVLGGGRGGGGVGSFPDSKIRV